jgi:hypothetical protein
MCNFFQPLFRYQHGQAETDEQQWHIGCCGPFCTSQFVFDLAPIGVFSVKEGLSSKAFLGFRPRRLLLMPT